MRQVPPDAKTARYPLRISHRLCGCFLVVWWSFATICFIPFTAGSMNETCDSGSTHFLVLEPTVIENCLL